MKYISLPKKFIVEETEAGKKAKVIIEPCFPGYGTTLGNSLRRAMLSSLPGGAITAVKIKGVQHEFTTIKNVTEDVLELILNLKQIRVKVFSDEPVILKLSAKGKKTVTAGDIESSADAEIINKDCVIATLNDKEASLEMEFTVAKGIGYVPTEDQGKGKGEIGLILVDSIFTPVLNVGMEVSATRVGQKTDYDKITLDIETDGTISPEDAVKKAAEILTNQFSWIMEGGMKEMDEIDIEAPVILPEGSVTPEEINEVLENSEVEKEEEDAEEIKTKKRGRPKKNEE